jgi:hypothetical protein
VILFCLLAGLLVCKEVLQHVSKVALRNWSNYTLFCSGQLQQCKGYSFTCLFQVPIEIRIAVFQIRESNKLKSLPTILFSNFLCIAAMCWSIILVEICLLVFFSRQLKREFNISPTYVSEFTASHKNRTLASTPNPLLLHMFSNEPSRAIGINAGTRTVQ